MPRTVTPLNATPASAPQGRHRKVGAAGDRMKYVEGLRGLAIALVVIFHVFIGRVSSGVDVFLFLGGIFLLSSQMSSAWTRRASMTQSILRILRRLMPVLVVVVMAITAASMALRPPALWPRLFTEASAAVGYWENWHLANSGFSYAAAGQEVSPFQHLWSMSAQMQIYLVVIAVVFAITAMMRGMGASQKIVRRTIVWLVSIAGLASLIYATVMVSHDQSTNYYSSFSRFWEIAAGCLFGLVLKKFVLGPGLRWIAGIVGLAMIISTGLLLNGAEQFPGPWTLIPLLGAAFVVSSGRLDPGEDESWTARGPVALLETAPMRWLGGISYTLYMVHWPLLILTIEACPEETSRAIIGPCVIAASLLLAWLAHKAVEVPLQQHVRPAYASVVEMLGRSYRVRARRIQTSPWYPVSAVAIVSCVALVIASPQIFDGVKMIQHKKNSDAIAALGGYDVAYPGSAALLQNAPVPEGVPITPDLTNIDAMFPQADRDHCVADFGNSDLVWNKPDGSPCVYGDTSSDKTLYIVGGSHSEQYLTALDDIGKRRHIKILMVIKLGCPLNSEEKRYDGADFTECKVWSSQNAVPWILNHPPTEGVFMTSTRPATIPGRGPELVPSTYVDIHKRLSDAGITVYSIRDNPWMMEGDSTDTQKDVRICLSAGRSAQDCGEKMSESLLQVNPAISAYKGIDKVHLLDITKAICSDADDYDKAFCPAVVGNVVTYRDSHHLTAQIIKTLSGYLEFQMFGSIAPGTSGVSAPTSPTVQAPVTSPAPAAAVDRAGAAPAPSPAPGAP